MSGMTIDRGRIYSLQFSVGSCILVPEGLAALGIVRGGTTQRSGVVGPERSGGGLKIYGRFGYKSALK